MPGPLNLHSRHQTCFLLSTHRLLSETETNKFPHPQMLPSLSRGPQRGLGLIPDSPLSLTVQTQSVSGGPPATSTLLGKPGNLWSLLFLEMTVLWEQSQMDQSLLRNLQGPHPAQGHPPPLSPAIQHLPGLLVQDLALTLRNLSPLITCTVTCCADGSAHLGLSTRGYSSGRCRGPNSGTQQALNRHSTRRPREGQVQPATCAGWVFFLSPELS